MSSKRNASFVTITVTAAAALAIAAFSAPALAVTTTGSLTISATVLSTCSLTGGTIPFGTYTSTQVDQTGSLNVLCTSGVPYTVSLDAGSASGATTSTRKMTTTSGGTLNYSLYREAAHSTNWGNVAGTDTVAGTGSGILQTVNVYGRIPAGQTPVVGAYTDTITVTLAY